MEQVREQDRHDDEHHEGREHDFEIVVNTKAHTVHDANVSYAQVVEFAYPGGLADPSFLFAVDYDDAKEHPRNGDLVAGQSVEVKHDGTEFCVIRSVRS